MSFCNLLPIPANPRKFALIPEFSSMATRERPQFPFSIALLSTIKLIEVFLEGIVDLVLTTEVFAVDFGVAIVPNSKNGSLTGVTANRTLVVPLARYFCHRRFPISEALWKCLAANGQGTRVSPALG